MLLVIAVTNIVNWTATSCSVGALLNWFWDFYECKSRLLFHIYMYHITVFTDCYEKYALKGQFDFARLSMI